MEEEEGRKKGRTERIQTTAVLGEGDAGTYGRRARSKIVRRGEAEEGKGKEGCEDELRTSRTALADSPDRRVGGGFVAELCRAGA
jgi:hypothetical protein